jgi:hypothetical protein
MVRSSNAEPNNAGLSLPTVWPSYRGNVQLASQSHLTRWRQAWTLRDSSRCELLATGSVKVVCAGCQLNCIDLESMGVGLVAALYCCTRLAFSTRVAGHGSGSIAGRRAGNADDMELGITEGNNPDPLGLRAKPELLIVMSMSGSTSWPTTVFRALRPPIRRSGVWSHRSLVTHCSFSVYRLTSEHSLWATSERPLGAAGEAETGSPSACMG